MTKIIVMGSEIVAVGPWTETSEAFECENAVIPKAAISGWQIVETELPEDFAQGGYEWSGGALARKSAPPPTQAEKDALIKEIDADVDGIYAAVIGNRQSEYALAESDASAYKAAGYTGAVPQSVQAWATASKQTAQWAADDILATAVQWRGAQSTIRENRLQRKEDVRNAETAAQMAEARAAWSSFVAAIRAQLGA
jgi:hypothetical protein